MLTVVESYKIKSVQLAIGELFHSAKHGDKVFKAVPSIKPNCSDCAFEKKYATSKDKQIMRECSNNVFACERLQCACVHRNDKTNVIFKEVYYRGR